ncbi:MAG: glycosyltransferase family 4 protein [Vicinamibacterales bacterium]
MRLLFLTETIPFPLDSGGRIKTFHTLRMLAGAHEVHLHALVRDSDRMRHTSRLEALGIRVTLHDVPRTLGNVAAGIAAALVTRRPVTVQRHMHRRVLRQLRDEVATQHFDAVYCDHLSMFEYGRRLSLPILLDAHNVEYAIVRRHAATLGRRPLRLLYEREWRALEAYERSAYPECRLIFCVSEVDAGVLRALGAVPASVLAVPISVDVSAMPPPTPLVSEPNLLFVGGLRWPPNADAVVYLVEEVLPRVRLAVPDARLTVVGEAPEALRERLAGRPGVRLVGYVDDLSPWFAASRALVVPIRSGSGMRVKILDGLARAIPIVTTRIGGEGINARDGEEWLVADSAADFAERVVRVLRDDRLAERLRAAGRAFVQRHHDVPVVRARLLEALRSDGPAKVGNDSDALG